MISLSSGSANTPAFSVFMPENPYLGLNIENKNMVSPVSISGFVEMDRALGTVYTRVKFIWSRPKFKLLAVTLSDFYHDLACQKFNLST